MKTIAHLLTLFPRSQALALLLGGGLLLSASAARAQTVFVVDDWYGSYSQMSGVSQGGTGSPTFQYTATAQGMGQVWAYFSDSPVQLADGAKMTLSTTLTVYLRDGATSVTTPLVFGIFQSSPRPPAPEGDSGRVVSGSPYTYGWKGFFTSTSSDSGVKDRVMRRNDNVVTYSNTSNMNISRSAMAEGFTAVSTFGNGEPIILELSLERQGDSLIFSGTLGGETFRGTFNSAFLEYSDTFDAIGFNMGTSTGVGFASVQFSNTRVTVIPEVSGVTLGLLGGGLLLVGVAFKRAK